MNGFLWLLDSLLRETLMFAAVGVLIGGVDELAVDFVHLFRLAHCVLNGRAVAPALSDLGSADRFRRYAILVPAWDEASVIGAMLRSTLGRLDHPDFRVLVGCYPNDGATIDAVAAVAAGDGRVRAVIGPRDGPTTKADCLNTLWRALLAEDAAAGRETDAIVLHDAEDVVHPAELRVFDALLGTHDVVQLPVLPLLDRRSTLVAGVVADEFAEAHSRCLLVRELVGAGMPLAGVGCAIRLEAMRRVAARHGAAFDADSLTEDYELGLRLAAAGARATLARISERPGGPVIAVREYFPRTLDTAVRQKARWMIGIALAGWDRTGWAGLGALGDHWMRMRDRRGPLMMVVLGAAYLALPLWAVSLAAHKLAGVPATVPDDWLSLLLRINAVLLAWRLAMRALYTGRAYGGREALASAPRMVVGNAIALLAARRALVTYVGMLRGAAPRWDKTAHRFPEDIGEASG